jgi:hypothetical protein
VSAVPDIEPTTPAQILLGDEASSMEAATTEELSARRRAISI